MRVVNYGTERADLQCGDMVVRAERNTSSGATSHVTIWVAGSAGTFVIHAPHPHIDDDLSQWALSVLARHVAGLPQI
jgi:hypothetical protein